MKKWYLYHNDDFCELGGHDFVIFTTQEQALEFIDKRLQKKGARPEPRGIDDYFLVCGTEIELEAAETAVRVRVISRKQEG